MILELILLSQAAVSDSTDSLGWQYSERSHVAPFGEKVRSAAASLRSEAGDARLLVKCDRSPKPALSVQVRRAPGNDDWNDGRLVLIHDNQPAKEVSWQLLDGVAFSQDKKEVRKVARLLISTSRLTVTGRDTQGRSVETRFQVSGGKRQLEHILAACAAGGKL